MPDESRLVIARYPIGQFTSPATITAAERDMWIRDIAECPSRMRAVVARLNDGQLSTPYREGGWTVRQVVHHVPDSHMNAYIRTKMALTEHEPVIKPYEESQWATLEDARAMPIDVSLRLVDALHERWVRLLNSLTDADFRRTFVHPEAGTMTIDVQMALYSWHSRHHVAHIQALRERMKW